MGAGSWPTAQPPTWTAKDHSSIWPLQLSFILKQGYEYGNNSHTHDLVLKNLSNT